MFFCMCNVLWTNEISSLSLNKGKKLLPNVCVFLYLCSLASIVHNLHDKKMILTEIITDHLFTAVLLFKTNLQMSFQIVHICMRAQVSLPTHEIMNETKQACISPAGFRAWKAERKIVTNISHTPRQYGQTHQQFTDTCTCSSHIQAVNLDQSGHTDHAQKSFLYQHILILRSFIRGSASSSSGTVFCVCI